MTVELPLPQHLSPSSLSTWLQCPLRFKFSRIDRVPEPPTSEQMIGSMTHEVLEALYKEPANQRTMFRAKQIAAELWATKWETQTEVLNLSVEELKRFRWQVWWCVEALFGLEDPTLVELGGIEHSVRTKIEGVTLLGIIDRWEDNVDGSVTIGDYKTGKKPRPQYEGEKKMQLTIYKILAEQELDREVRHTELLYLKDGIRWRYEPTEDEVSITKETVVNVWSEIVQGCSTGKFEARTSVLCGWCSFKRMCPAFMDR